MGGSKFIPIVIAGVVGLFIGWIVSPDVDEVTDQVNGHVDTLKGPIDQIQAQLKSLTAEVSKPAAPAPAATPSDQPDKTDTAVAALGTKIDQLTSDLQARIDAVGKAIKEQPAPQPQQQAAASSAGQSAGGQGGDPAKLASQIGKTGAILLPGQAAIFGGQRVSLASLSAEKGSASIAVGDGDAKDVKNGGAIDVSDNCKVTLAGVAAGAGYFSASDCKGAAKSAAKSGGEKQAAADAAGAKSTSSDDKAKAASGGGDQAAAKPQKPVAASGKDKPKSAKSNDKPAAQAAGNATEATVPVGAVAALGSKRIFVSAIGDNNASLFVAGDFSSGKQTRQTVEVGKTMDAGDGCKVTLAGIDNGQAKLTSEGCAGGGSSDKAASANGADKKSADAAGQKQAATSSDGTGGSSGSKPADDTAKKTPSQSSGGQQAAASGSKADGSGGSATEATVPVGAAAALGNKRIFVSAIGDNNASLFVAGDFSSGKQTRQSVDVGKSMDAGDGCKITLASIDNGQAKLTSEGCAGSGAAAKSGDAAGSADKAASGQKAPAPAAKAQAPAAQAPAAGGDKKASAEAPASSGSSASTGGEQKPAASGDKQASAAGSSALSVGQTGTYGDHKVFVSSLGDGSATLYVVGTGRKEVKTGSSVDLGGGCAVKLDKVDNGAASMTASGC